MKLSEMSTDKLFDVLAEITPEIGTITSDTEFSEAFKASKLEGETKTQYGLRRILTILPFLFDKYRHSIYKIISAVNEKSVEEIAQQKGAQTIKEITELIRDKDLMSFFQ